MVAKKVNRSESAKKIITYDNDDDVSCWNCAIPTNSEKNLEPVTLAKVRQEHREKFKLYSFLASELSKPKVVPLKQKISEPLTITKIVGEKLAEDAKVCNNDGKESHESNLAVLPLNTESYVYQISTENINDLTSELLTQKQVSNVIKTRKKIKKDEKVFNMNNKAENLNKISPNHELSEIVIDNTQESVTVLYNLEIKTPSKIKRDLNKILTKISFSENDETAHEAISQDFLKEIKDDCDQIDNANSNSLDFGNAISFIRDINEQFTSNKTMDSSANTQPYSCSEPSHVRKLNNCKDFERSMPVLYASSQDANETLTKSMNSLCAESSFNKKVKMMRWSSFSLCKKPYDNDGMFHNLFLVEFLIVSSRNHVNKHQSPLL